MENPAQGGVSECRSGKLDNPDDTRKIHDPQAAAGGEFAAEVVYQPCADECCYRLARALRAGRLDPDSWSFNFTRSVLKHSKRTAWVPSPKRRAE